MFRIVETDNFGRDYPDEKFLNISPIAHKEYAKQICDAINRACSGQSAPRYWKVVPVDYKLQPGFEP